MTMEELFSMMIDYNISVEENTLFLKKENKEMRKCLRSMNSKGFGRLGDTLVINEADPSRPKKSKEVIECQKTKKVISLSKR